MLWEKIKNSLKDKLPSTTHGLWIEPLDCVNQNEKEIALSCPDRFFCSWVRDNYSHHIRESLNEFGREELSVRFTVSDNVINGHDDHNIKEQAKEQLRLPSIPEVQSNVRNLHPRYTFEEFMVGDSNVLAQSACRSISVGDSSLGPSLYINAGTGLGKSHLTHAVAHDVITNSPGTRLHYLTAQQFSAEMVQGIKCKSMDQFKEKYYNHCDLLLIEDVHTLTGKTKTQTELNDILDVLMKAGKRIILTGAMSPRDIPNIDNGFRSRMSAGLISTINPPDQKTRIRIIRRKALNCNLQLSESLIKYLAHRIKGDIRQVESAIVGLKAKSALLKSDPNMEMVNEVIREIVGSMTTELTSDAIRDFIAEQFNIRITDLQSKSRKKSIAFPRQVSMYLSRKLTEQALSDIGRSFNRDHSTVLHSIKVISDAVARNGSVRGQVKLLEDKLKE